MDQALAQLEELIVTLELHPGSVWSEAELCQMLGIGRTPVREALKRLESEHLVETIPRYGVKITEINPQDQLLLLETRGVLERLVVISAARRATEPEREQCVQMAVTLLSMVDSDVREFLRYHYYIKRVVAEMARNPYTAGALMPFYAISRRFYYMHHLRTKDVPLAAKYHANILRAIAKRDEVQAANASDLLIDYAVQIAKASA